LNAVRGSPIALRGTSSRDTLSFRGAASDQHVTIFHAVFAGGIEARLSDNKWAVSGRPAPLYDSLEDVARALAALPVMISYQDSPETPIFKTILNAATGRALNVTVIELNQHMFSADRLFHVRYLQYLFSALNYHCKQMVGLYADCTVQMEKVSRIPKFGTDDHVMRPGHEEMYFEFDAIVSVALRLYDAPGPLLWNVFSKKKGGCPKHIPDVLKACAGIPEQLRNELSRSWQTFGPRLKDYRDCVHHHTSLEMQLGTADLIKNAQGLWTTLLRIPDNPDVKSSKAFKLTQRLDAMQYSLDVLREHAANLAAIGRSLPSSQPAG
jgi:hypothetical protein